MVNFVLYNEEVAEAAKADFMKTGKVQEDCWGGTQARTVTVASK